MSATRANEASASGKEKTAGSEGCNAGITIFAALMLLALPLTVGAASRRPWS